jgi:hypothetical protein
MINFITEQWFLHYLFTVCYVYHYKLFAQNSLKIHTILHTTVVAFCLDTKKRERGWRQLACRPPAGRIVPKQNASPV